MILSGVQEHATYGDTLLWTIGVWGSYFFKVLSQLVGDLEHVLFFQFGYVISSQLTNSIVFQRGRWLNHQPVDVPIKHS